MNLAELQEDRELQVPRYFSQSYFEFAFGLSEASWISEVAVQILAVSIQRHQITQGPQRRVAAPCPLDRLCRREGL